NWSVRKIFLYNSAYIIGKGLLWGNIIGISICVLQYYFKILHLDPESYYVNFVPISFNFIYLILLNVCTIIICVLMLLLPSYIITRISPVKAIRFN
ncbi:MAG: FtsX-like permease family protein, partial [Saprospiraceae bacterium]|nr:FtsX-like permease family protein [Saprospiraceae bacterium]